MNLPIENTFRRLSLELLSRLARSKSVGTGQAIYITSPQAREGKTTIAAGLAFTIARQSAERLLLVDANVEAPVLTSMIPGAAHAVGLSDALRARGKDPVEAMHTGVENLWFVPVGQTPQAGLLFHREVVDRIMADLKNRFDVILFDGAGLMRTGANALAHTAEHLIYVLDNRFSRREVSEQALRSLRLEAEKLALIVLNNKLQYIPEFLYRRV